MFTSAPMRTHERRRPQAIKKIRRTRLASGAYPRHQTPPRSRRDEAGGLEASKGVISVNYGKDPLDPTWKDDAGMKKFFDFMAKYYPDGDKDSSFNTYGYSTTQLLIYDAPEVRRRSDPRRTS